MVQCHSENDGASKIIVVQLYLGAQAVLVPLITGEAIRNQQLALPQYANTLLSCVRYQIPRPHNLRNSVLGRLGDLLDKALGDRCLVLLQDRGGLVEELGALP